MMPQPPALSRAVLTLGEPAFPQALLEALARLIPCDHLNIFSFDAQLRPHLMGVASRKPGNMALAAGRVYSSGRYYQHDPGVRRVQAAGGSGPVLLRLRAVDIQDVSYRREIYDRFRLLERLSVIDRVRERWLMLNLYRSTDGERFSSRDLAGLRELAVLLISLAGKHVSLLGGLPAQETNSTSASSLDVLLQKIDTRLTERERAVCARALTGQTVQGIASDLGIRPPTVATLRRRAYAKLNISSLNELFALCMKELARSQLTSAERGAGS